MNEDSLKSKLDMKLSNGEIDQEEYEELLKKFDELDLLSSKVNTKSKVVAVGVVKLKSEIVDGPVRVSGKLMTHGPLKCENMSISGSASISGDLVVVGTTKISGRISIDGDAKFGDKISISGKFNSDGNTFCTDILRSSGKFSTSKDLVLGNNASITGKLNAQSIRSNSPLSISGKMNVENDVLAKEFISSGGISTIGGNLQAELIEIAKEYRMKSTNDKSKEVGEGIPDLGSFISKLVTSFIPSVIEKEKPGEFLVMGDIRGSNIDISHTHIKGDIVGRDIIIGPEVVVEGEIQYVNSIDAPEGYKIIRIKDEL